MFGTGTGDKGPLGRSGTPGPAHRDHFSWVPILSNPQLSFGQLSPQALPGCLVGQGGSNTHSHILRQESQALVRPGPLLRTLALAVLLIVSKIRKMCFRAIAAPKGSCLLPAGSEPSDHFIY